MRRFLLISLLFPLICSAQMVNQPGAAQIKLKLKKLNFLGSVLYMAAHPDDENTRVITFLSNDKLATTAYLSLTRGDGGQNLIGPEIRDLLGVIRTQELLAARRIDGGQQFFTRANDFGFSKSPAESFEIWGKDQILNDVVKVFRMYQPDVIITRFPPDERAGHGHHTASAMLAGEAFNLSADAGYDQDQIKQFGLWQTKRLYTNTGRWWNKDINESTPGVLTLNVGGYNSLLGKSYTEISALSSSQHKSQGWGRQGERGYAPEFLEYVKGERADKDIFEGVNTTWSRLKGGDKIQPLVDRAISDFNEENPASSVAVLLQLKKAIASLDKSVWRDRKLQEVEQLIIDCLALYTETSASKFSGSPGENVQATFEIVNRSAIPVSINRISSAALNWDTTFSQTLEPNKKLTFKSKAKSPSDTKYSQPYWLAESHSTGIFTVKEKSLIGSPENSPAVDFEFEFNVEGEKLVVRRPLIYKWVDPVKGELWRPFEFVPPVFVNVADKVVIFNDQNPRDVRVVVSSSVDRSVTGELKLSVPEGWRAEPSAIPYSLERSGQQLTKVFRLYPSSVESKGLVQATATADGKAVTQGINLIQYEHIPIQTILPPAQIQVVRVDLKKEGSLIGYIRGAGDEVPSALRNMGYEVWEMKNEEITPDNLKKVDAVVLGIRAVNTNEKIRFWMADVLKYAEEGGTVVVQYNTSGDLEVETFSPYPLKLSRDRVSEENAEVRILKPDHPVLNYPNKITANDFAGWVQERGLYFPSQWDEQYTALLSMNDKNETPKDGSLLVAKYGKGYYVYTGLSFFRELPEGVVGAYKLFANLVSIGKQSGTVHPAKKQKTK